MNFEDALKIIDALLKTERLKDVQELVFRQSWLGKTYQEIAEESGYSAEHIRDVGFRLWQLLSDVLGEKVTKSTIHAILRQRSLQGTGDGEEISSIKGSPEPSKLRTNRTYRRSLLLEEQEPLISDYSLVPSQVFPISMVGTEFPGPPLVQNSPFYIDRYPVEQRCYQELLRGGSFLRIKASHKMGKTSLLNRILHNAIMRGYTKVRLNLHQVDQNALNNTNAFLRWFCKSISWKLNLEPKLDAYWDQDLGLAKLSCSRYFEKYLLTHIQSPLVLALDDVDHIFTYPQLAQDFLPLLRIWHEEGHENDVWQHLRLVVVHATDNSIPLNVNQSPFHMGLPIQLEPWQAEHVEDLAQRYRLIWDDQATEQLMGLTAGHPYLIQLAFYYLWHEEGSLNQLLREASADTSIFSPYLQQQLDILYATPFLATAMKQVIESDRPILLEPAIAHQLQGMGLVQFWGNAILPSCQLYAQYFRYRL